jgi:membrane protein YqaA with SNARE-associated domain
LARNAHPEINSPLWRSCEITPFPYAAQKLSSLSATIGKETSRGDERKFSARTLDKVYRIFGRWGFGAIAIAALLPPPGPMVPFLFAAGAIQYSVGKFLLALTVGRIVRYSFLAFLAAHYGRQIS